MKKHIFLLILFFAVMFCLAAAPPGKSRITLQNSTGYEISEVYVSPASADDWGDDYLVNATLDDGDSFTISLPRSLSETNMYDIQFVDIEGDSYTRFDVAVKSGATVEITMDDLDEYDDDEYYGDADSIE
jgi:hypothetical protein